MSDSAMDCVVAKPQISASDFAKLTSTKPPFAKLDFALIGAGQLGEMFLDLWPDHLPRPRFILDTTRRGKLRGIDIRDLQTHKRDPSLTYVLSAFKIPAPQAHAFFQRFGQNDQLTVYDLLYQTSPHILSNGWMNLNPSPSDESRVEAARACYTDAESLRVFDAVVAWRYRRELLMSYPVGAESKKYDLSAFRANRHIYAHVYDCGAYDLSLVRAVTEAGFGFTSYCAFEPDPLRHAICEREKQALDPAMTQRLRIEPVAVCDRRGIASFNANGLFCARLMERDLVPEATSLDVETVCLDSYHSDQGGTFDSRDRVLIKAHVEGAEPKVLAGARKLLERCRTDVLVNLTHDEASLVDIPCYLKSIGPFKLALRSTSLFGEGLTLFASKDVR